jgi:hypothetical protein
MSAIATAAVAFAAGAALVVALVRLARARALGRRTAARTIAFPFTGLGLSEPALAAALRIAHAEGATLMPVYLALVPLELPLDVPLSGQCEAALPLLETIEQRAARADVPVDSRIERGRSERHALAQLMGHERFERMVVASAPDEDGGDGLAPHDVAWLLRTAPGEVVVVRPAPDGRLTAGPRRRRATTPSRPRRERGRPRGWGALVLRGVANDVAGRRRRL